MCVSACRTFTLRLALVFNVSVCFLKISSGSRVTPMSVELGLIGMGVL